MIYDLGKIPCIYKEDIKIFEKEYIRITKKYPNCVNFINNKKNIISKANL